MIYFPNYKNLKILAKSLAILGFSSSLCTFDAQAYSLHDAIITAHEKNPGILMNYEQLQQVYLQKTKALADFLPTATFNNQSSLNKYMFIPGNVTSANKIKHKNNSTFTISQPIFDSGGSLTKIIVADESSAAKLEVFKTQSNKLSLDVVNAYAEYVYAQKAAELSVKNEQVYKEHLNVAQIKFDHGELTKTDVYSTKSEYAQSVAALQKSQGDLSTAKAALEQLTTTPVPEKVDDIDVASIVLPAKFEEFQEISLKNNPDLKSGKFAKSAADHNVYVASSAILPSVSAQAKVNRSNAPLLNYGNQDGETYLLNVQIPIFNPQGLLNIKNSQYEAHIAKQQLNGKETSLQNSLVQIWSQYKTTLAMLTSNKETIVAANQALVGTKAEYKAGTKTTLDLLNAERQQFKVNVSLKEIERDNAVATFSMLYLMGAIESVSSEEQADNS